MNIRERKTYKRWKQREKCKQDVYNEKWKYKSNSIEDKNKEIVQKYILV